VIAYHGFQNVKDGVQVLREVAGWDGFLDDWAEPLRTKGVVDHHLHNPFGLHDDETDLQRKMHIDQFERSCSKGLAWLADAAGFKAVVEELHAKGGTVAAYVGSPLVYPDSLAGVSLPTCSPGSRSLTRRLGLLRALRLCGVPPLLQCSCWSPLVRFHLAALLDARVDRIGFDWSADFMPGSCMDGLVRSLIDARIEVMIEDWPFAGRTYPSVSWIIREVRYHQIRWKPGKKQPTSLVTAPVYRIVPTPNTMVEELGITEIAAINELLVKLGELELDSEKPSQDLVQRIRNEGHIPLVRARQLRSAEVR
jgi:hypothetical protein